MARVRGSNGENITVSKFFTVANSGNRVRVDYEFYNRPEQITHDSNFFYLNIYDEDGNPLSTEQAQDQVHDVQSVVGYKEFARTDGENYQVGEIIEVRFRPYQWEPNYYHVALGWVQVEIV